MQTVRRLSFLTTAACALGALSPTTGFAALIDDHPENVAGAAAFGACSRVFVSGMSVEEAKYRDAGFLRQAGVDDPDADVSIGTYGEFGDPEGGTVLAIVRHDGATVGMRLAVYEPGHGCTVLVDKTLSEQLADRLPPPSYDANQPYFYWPYGTASNEAYLSAGEQAGVAAAIAPLFGSYDGPQIDPAEQTDLKTLAVAVAKDGELVFERYLGDDSDVPVGVDTRLLGFSLTKTVLGMALGAWVTDTMDSQGVPEHQRAAWIDAFLLQHAPVPEGGLATNRYRQLLRMNTDLSWNEVNNAPNLLFGPSDTALAAASWPRNWVDPIHGGYINIARYCSASSVLLSWALQDAVGGREATLDYLQSNLFEPARITSPELPADEAGTLQGASSLHMTARDWLRIGQLFLDNGRVDGTQYGTCPDLDVCGEEVIAPQWMDVMRDLAWQIPFTDSRYAGHVWRTRLEVADDAIAGRTESVLAFVFKGLGHQRIFVVPDRGVVLVRLASDFESVGGPQTRNAIKGVLDALNPQLQ